MNRPHSRYVEGSHFRLIEERLARKWSTFDIAKKINVSRSTYTQVETGCRRGSEYIWQSLEEVLGVPKEELKQ